MAHAVEERERALLARATELLQQAAADNEPWLAALGPRPAEPGRARLPDQAALAAVAYRDRHQVTGPEPLDRPDGIAQRRDANRIRALAPPGGSQTRGSPPLPSQTRRVRDDARDSSPRRTARRFARLGRAPGRLRPSTHSRQ
jgi:hypothetical protein